MNNITKDSVVLIAGGTGSVGTALVKWFLDKGVRQVRVLARDETRHQQLVDRLDNPPNLLSIIGDVRDKSSMDEALNGVDIVINAAAMKHVKYCEAFPLEATKTNVTGTDNLLSLCIHKHIKNFIFVSSDKAVDPTTVYGTSKSLAEGLVISSALHNPVYNFNIVRLGNVLGSRNSVLSRIAYQLDSGKPITINRNGVLRYVMTASQAADIIVSAIQYGKGGEIFIKDMPIVEIAELIYVFIEQYAERNGLDSLNTQMTDYPTSQGEKLSEALVTKTEISRLRFIDDLIIVSPKDTSTATITERAYDSGHEPKLNVQQIGSLLRNI